MILYGLITAFTFLWLIVRPLSVPFSVLMGRKQSKENVEIEGISILVPCHNEEESLAATVESLLKQRVNKEIILIENGSSDRTYEVAKELESRYPEVVATTVQVPKGQFPISVAMNHGVQLAKFPYMIRLDADTKLIDPHALSKAVTPIATGRAVATACNVRLSNMKESLLTRIQSIEYFFSMEMDRRSQRLYNGVLVASGAMQCLRVDLVKKAGGYTLHPWNSEDMDITLKMHQFGKVEMTPTAISYTDAPTTWKVLLKQRHWWMILGVMCMVIHRKSIGRKVGHKGGLGLIALPLKIFTSFQSLIGIGIKAYLLYRMTSFEDTQSVFMALLLMTSIHLGVIAFTMIVVAPVAVDKQGCSQWWVIPFFALVYQPIMGFLRLFALFSSLKVLLKYGASAGHHSFQKYQEAEAAV